MPRSLPRRPLRAPTAVLFDLDGTIIDSRRDIAAACNHALVARGYAALSEAEVATFVGDGARTLVARALDLPRDHAEVGATLEIFLEYYAAHPIDHARYMPFAEAALRAAARVPLGLVTNKSRRVTEPIVGALALSNLFSAVVAGGECALKPSAEPLLLASRRLGVQAADVWMVGDGVQDVLAGRAAGCFTIAVLGGFHEESRLRELGPDLVLPSLEELPPLLERAVF